MPFLPTFHLPPLQNVFSHWLLEEETLLGFWSARTAFPDSTGAGKLACWTPILTQYPNKKNGAWEAIAIALLWSLACELYSVQYVLTVYSLVQQPVQCSKLCMPLYPHYLHNVTANCALVPQYRNVSAVVKLRVHLMHYLGAIDCGEGNTVVYTPRRRSHEGVYCVGTHHWNMLLLIPFDERGCLQCLLPFCQGYTFHILTSQCCIHWTRNLESALRKCSSSIAGARVTMAIACLAVK